MLTHESIQLKAFIIYQDRCRRGIPGNDKDDWAEAERQLKALEQLVDYRFYYPTLGDDYTGRVDLDRED